MLTGSVVLAPALPGEPEPQWRKEIQGGLLGWGVPTFAVSIPEEDPDLDERSKRAHWVGNIAIALAEISPPPPMLLVLGGSAAHGASAVGFSQKASRRAVVGYVLIDPVLPEMRQGIDWPDAPVTVLLTEDLDPDTAAEIDRAAGLRGYEVVKGDAADLIVGIARR